MAFYKALLSHAPFLENTVFTKIGLVMDIWWKEIEMMDIEGFFCSVRSEEMSFFRNYEKCHFRGSFTKANSEIFKFADKYFGNPILPSK